jgi:hypothetical protein
MRDIHNTIEGPGEEVKAALWFYFCKWSKKFKIIHQ